ncbi:MAG: hypothetical protein GX364_07235 [Firmicutes bacterium]|jgi:hypothetical protein|nr:hypothetical protein [Bacillota bacterium]
MNRVTDAEVFTRLLYFGTVHLNRTEEETWLTPVGFLLDLWECHRQFLRLAKPKRELFVDEIIPSDLI